MARVLKILIASLILFMTHVGAWAQMPIKLQVAPQVDPDSVDLAYYGKKHFWRAAGTVAGFNIGLWAFDRYVQNGDFARISLHSVKENFKHGFKWDNDKLGTNMFLHPYNGNLFYNAARSNGYNYWQSGLFAIGGSAMWEMFMECEYPSTNDIIATPIGGMAIGEVCYRASDAVLDDRSTGGERVRREVAAFLISPMRGLTRIINGDAWRKRSTTGRQFGTPSVAMEFSAGIRGLEFENEVYDSSLGFSMQFNLEYGDRFEVKSSHPYDYFRVRADINIVNSQPLLGQLDITGRLIARELLEKERSHMSIGLYQHFDYYDSDTISEVSAKCPYKLGIPASLGCGLMFRDIERNRWVLDAYLHSNAVILGSVLSDYYKVDERNYNLASGFSIKGGANMVFNRDKFSASLSHAYYRLFTWKGYHQYSDLDNISYKVLDAQGDHSVASFIVTEARCDLKLWRKLYLTLSFTHYMRSTHYRDFGHIKSSSMATRLMLTYKL